MTDGHEHTAQSVVVSPSTRRVLVMVIVPLLLALIAGLVVLWPGALQSNNVSAASPDDLFTATITGAVRGECEDGRECITPTVRLEQGPDEGDEIELFAEPVDSGFTLDVGEQIVVGYYGDAEPGFEYSLADHERRQPLLLLVAIFAVAVIALARWKGLRALAGVAVSIGVLAAFILPALLDGSSPVAVALVGAGLIAVIALYLAHGVNAGSTVALIGAFASLVLVGLLAWFFVELTHLTGRAAEEALFLQVSAAQVDLRGLVLAGVVIGTLGVLDDVTVLQVSAVWELHHADPTMGWRRLYGAAIRIGRDHVASTVNTLVLAYAGAALPLFLLLTQAQQSLSDTANSEVVATEIVRALVGSIGLVAAVPITTALAVWVISRPTEDAEPRSDPRRYRSRAERDLWAAADAPPAAAEPPPPPAL